MFPNYLELVVVGVKGTFRDINQPNKVAPKEGTATPNNLVAKSGRNINSYSFNANKP